MTVEEGLSTAVLTFVATWGLRKPLDAIAQGLLLAVLLPLRLAQNRIRIGVWDIRPTDLVADEILAEDGGSA